MQTFQADIFLLQEWTDFRLANDKLKLNETLTITQSEFINQFWKPDLYFVNSREIKLSTSLEQVEKLTIDSEGNIAYMLRLQSTFICKFNLLNYPHDYHNCPIKISSLKYSPNVNKLSFVCVIFTKYFFNNFNNFKL